LNAAVAGGAIGAASTAPDPSACIIRRRVKPNFISIDSSPIYPEILSRGFSAVKLQLGTSMRTTLE